MCCKAMTHFSVTVLYLITMKPYREEREKKWGCLSWKKWLCEPNHCEVLYRDCFSLENSAKSKIISIIVCIADIKQIENAFLFDFSTCNFFQLLQYIKFLSEYNYNLFISDKKCPFGVLPISSWSRDMFSNEPFSTSTLKLPISWQILPATDLSIFSTAFFFFLFHSKWILVAFLDSCWQEWRYLPSVQMHIGHGKKFRQFPKQWAWGGNQYWLLSLPAAQVETQDSAVRWGVGTELMNRTPLQGGSSRNEAVKVLMIRSEGIWLCLKQLYSVCFDMWCPARVSGEGYDRVKTKGDCYMEMSFRSCKTMSEQLIVLCLRCIAQTEL